MKLKTVCISLSIVFILFGCKTTTMKWVNNEYTESQVQSQFQVDSADCKLRAHRAVSGKNLSNLPKLAANYGLGTTGFSEGIRKAKEDELMEMQMRQLEMQMRQLERIEELRNDIYRACMTKKGWRQIEVVEDMF